MALATNGTTTQKKTTTTTKSPSALSSVIMDNWKNNTSSGTTTKKTGTVISPTSSTYKSMANSSMSQAYTDAGSPNGVVTTTETQTPTYTPKATATEETNTGYDYTALIEALQKINQEKYSALEQALLRNKQTSDDEANRAYARNLRDWKRTYSGGLSGQGLSQKFNLMANRDSTLAQNQSDYLNNVATAKSGKYDDYASLASNLSGLDSTSLKKILSSI